MLSKYVHQRRIDFAPNTYYTQFQSHILLQTLIVSFEFVCKEASVKFWLLE